MEDAGDEGGGGGGGDIPTPHLLATDVDGRQGVALVWARHGRVFAIALCGHIEHPDRKTWFAFPVDCPEDGDGPTAHRKQGDARDALIAQWASAGAIRTRL